MNGILRLTNNRYPVIKVLAAALLFSMPVSVTYAGAIRSADLFSNTLASEDRDDGSTDAVALGFTVRLNATNFSNVYVNTNGNVTFGSALGSINFTPPADPDAPTKPSSLSDADRPILAPFFADVDTSASGKIEYGQGIIAGKNVFGVNWIDVGYFDARDDKLNSFQLIITDRSDVKAGDFDFEFNYDKIAWETGSFSGGLDGLGRNSAHVGWSNGPGLAETYLELPGSGEFGAFLDGGPNSLVANSRLSPQPGRYVIEVRDGIPLSNVPLPAGLPLFLSGLAFLGWRSKKVG